MSLSKIISNRNLMIPVLLIFILSIISYDLFVFRGMQKAKADKVRNLTTGIIQGAESIRLEGHNQKAVLLIHGYVGSPRDFESLPDLLHEKGYTVSAPLLPGHGSDPVEFSRISAEELIDFVINEYDVLKRDHEEVSVVGFSMGAALATILVHKRQSEKTVLLAAYYQIADARKYILPLDWYARLLSGIVPYFYQPLVYKQVNDRSRIDEMVYYDYISLKGTLAAMEIAKIARRYAEELPENTVFFHSRADKATDYKTVETLCARKGFILRAYNKSNHILLWDYESEEIKSAILNLF